MKRGLFEGLATLFTGDESAATLIFSGVIEEYPDHFS
jgi:hypothetical protein